MEKNHQEQQTMITQKNALVNVIVIVNNSRTIYIPVGHEWLRTIGLTEGDKISWDSNDPTDLKIYGSESGLRNVDGETRNILIEWIKTQYSRELPSDNSSVTGIADLLSRKKCKQIKRFIKSHGKFDIFLSATTQDNNGDKTVDYIVANLLKKVFDDLHLKTFWWADSSDASIRTMNNWGVYAKIAVGLGLAETYVGLAFFEEAIQVIKKDPTNTSESNFFKYEIETFNSLEEKNDPFVVSYFNGAKKDAIAKFNRNDRWRRIPRCRKKLFFHETDFEPDNTSVNNWGNIKKLDENLSSIESSSIDTIKKLVEDVSTTQDNDNVKKRAIFVLRELYNSVDCVKRAIDNRDPKKQKERKNRRQIGFLMLWSLLCGVGAALFNFLLPALAYLANWVKVLIPCLWAIPPLFALILYRTAQARNVDYPSRYPGYMAWVFTLANVVFIVLNAVFFA